MFFVMCISAVMRNASITNNNNLCMTYILLHIYFFINSFVFREHILVKSNSICISVLNFYSVEQLLHCFVIYFMHALTACI